MGLASLLRPEGPLPTCRSWVPLRRYPNSEAAVIAARLARGHCTSIPSLRMGRGASRLRPSSMVCLRKLAVNDLLRPSSRSGTYIPHLPPTRLRSTLPADFQQRLLQCLGGAGELEIGRPGDAAKRDFFFSNVTAGRDVSGFV